MRQIDVYLHLCVWERERYIICIYIIKCIWEVRRDSFSGYHYIQESDYDSLKFFNHLSLSHD